MQKKAKRCIFCGGGKLTREHFWPKWSASLFPITDDDGRVEVSFKRQGAGDHLAAPPLVISRSGRVITKKLRVVCGPCNNTWMSRIESEAKEVLRAGFDGRCLLLSGESLRKLVEWIALKVMLSEFSQQGDFVTPFGERQAFRETRTIPETYSIFIGACGIGRWRSAHFRQCATYTLPGYTPSPLAPKNTETVTIGFGTMVFFVLVQPIEKLFTVDFTQKSLLQLWPSLGIPVAWPPPKFMSESDVDRLSYFLDDIPRACRVVWKPS